MPAYGLVLGSIARVGVVQTVFAWSSDCGCLLNGGSGPAHMRILFSIFRVHPARAGISAS
jgi:hypothetical protein